MDYNVLNREAGNVKTLLASVSNFFKDKNLDNLNSIDARFQRSQKSLEGMAYLTNLSEAMIYEEYS
jgi:hypothetical protein